MICLRIQARCLLVYCTFFHLVVNSYWTICQLGRNLVNQTNNIFYSSILGISKINGFYCLNYADERETLSHIGDQVCTFRFQQKPITIHYGADSIEKLAYLDWKKHCNKFLKNFYTSNGQFTEVITVPDTVKETDMIDFWTMAMNTLKKWCSPSNNGSGLIVTNFDIINNLELLGLKKSDLTEILMKKEFQRDKQRLIVFNVVENIIFVIRRGSDDLEEKIVNCIDDVNLLSLLLKEELNQRGVKIAGLLVREKSSANKHDTKKCYRCKYFIVPPEIFSTQESFLNFWLIFKDMKEFEKVDAKETAMNKMQILQDVASKILGYMSRHNPGILPKLMENDPIKNIEQAEMLMDRYQMEIAYSKKTRIILQGDYGSGKTVIALKKIQLLLKTMQSKETIYYVSFDAKCELHHVIKQRLKSFCKLNQNVKVIQGGHSLSSIIESRILPEEKEIGTKNIHLFVDEFSSEKLSKIEVYKLNKIFAEGTLFQNVLIAAQPIKIDRHMIFRKGSTSQIEKGHWFQRLIKFEVYHLKYVMRTTVQINTLAKVTQDFLNYKSNEYNHCQDFVAAPTPDQLIIGIKENVQNYNHNKSLKFKAVFLKVIKPMRKIMSYFNQETPLRSHSVSRLHRSKSYRPHTASDITQFSTSGKSVQFNTSDNILRLSKEIPDYDELYKLASSGSNKSNTNNKKILTTYAYTCQSKIGHGIQGPLPEIIKLAESISPLEQIGLIGIMLKKKFDRLELKQIVIIHFEPSDSLWQKSLLKLPQILPSLNVTTDVEFFLENCSDSLILVKNYKFVKGLEFSNVLLVVDSNEYYLKQFIPEAITRCQSNLLVLIKSHEKESCKTDAVIDLVNCWDQINSEEEKPILRKLQLKFCTKRKCSIKADHEEECCQEKLESGAVISYNVHKNSKPYRCLLEVMKVSDEISDEQETKEKAIAV